MLVHRQAAGRGQQGRAGREIQAAGAIPASADDVDRINECRQIGAASQRAHAARKAAQFLGTDTLGAQCGEHGASQRRGKIGRGQRGQQLHGLRLIKARAIQQPLERGAQRHGLIHNLS